MIFLIIGFTIIWALIQLNKKENKMSAIECGGLFSLKPKPCLGCGFCCIKIPCGVAYLNHGSEIKECPDLYWDGKRYKCKFADQSEKNKKILYIGEGCCAGLNTWRKSIEPRREMDK
jgi:Fe-S-cluster-containing dehydrogenase component